MTRVHLVSRWTVACLAIAALAGIAVTPVDARTVGRRLPVERGVEPVSEQEATPPALDPAVAAVVPAGPVDVAVSIAVDAIDVAAAERKLRLIAVLTNAGGEVELAICPGLFFDGTVRPVQGYAFVPGEPNADCSLATDHAPTLGFSLDAIPTGDPACPAAPPVSATGDKVVVPAGDAGTPGMLVVQYDVLLADLDDGLENESPEEIRKRIAAGDGLALHTLTDIDAELAALVCPAGVDAFLAAAPDPQIATIATTWLHAPAPAAETVEAASTLYSPRSLGADEDINAIVEVEWSDNVDPALADVLVHDPEPGVEFVLTAGEFVLGKLTATLPADLEEGFRGEAIVKVYEVATDDGGGNGEEAAATEDVLLSESRHPIVVDTTGPVVLAATTTRSKTDIAIEVEVEDATSGLGAVRQWVAINATDEPSALMDFAGGDFEAPTMYSGLVDPAAETDVVGVRVQADDRSGNVAEATLPVAAAGEDATFECTTDGGADVTLDGTGSTAPPEDEALTTFTWDSDAFETPLEGEMVDAFLPLGETDVTLTLEDDRGFVGTDEATYLVEDTTPPVIDGIELSRECLWPPNHKYVRFVLDEDVIVIADDVCDPDLDVRIVDVESNQPDNGRGDGNTSNDAVYADEVFCVRSERTGRYKGDRVYTVTIEVTDDSGNSVLGTTEVRVPHDQRDGGCPSLEGWQFADKDRCDLERIGQSDEAHRLLRRGKPGRSVDPSSGRRSDRAVRGSRR